MTVLKHSLTLKEELSEYTDMKIFPAPHSRGFYMRNCSVEPNEIYDEIDDVIDITFYDYDEKMITESNDDYVRIDETDENG